VTRFSSRDHPVLAPQRVEKGRRFASGSVIASLAAALLFAPPGASAKPVEKKIWTPRPGVSWQLQLSGRPKLRVKAKVFDIDGFDNNARVVRRLHRKGRRVICYISAGSFERWRPDAARFPKRVKGRSNGWPGERWLDIRRLKALRPIMRDRLDMCARKGFDGADFDNVDGYTARTGFPIEYRHQLRYNRWLARAARARGLAAGLKNDAGQARVLEADFEFAVVEQCFQYRECRRYRSFIAAAKAVFETEYELNRNEFCSKARRLDFSAIRKRLRLGGWRRACPGLSTNHFPPARPQGVTARSRPEWPL
jgi:hypothetical protein